MSDTIKNNLPHFPYSVERYTLNNWMSNIPVIDSLSLGELVLPGAHNAGMDKKAPNYDIFSGHWLTCQNDSFYYQLTQGARALDLRLGYERTRAGNDRFYFHHNGGESFRYLENLFNDVNRFLQENPDEFIVLDVHELTSGNTPFDHKAFNGLVLKHLEHRIITSGNSHLSLRQLKQVSRLRRVLVAAYVHPDLDSTYFHRQIKHKWSGISDTSVSELKTYITEVMESPPASVMPWSLSATSYNLLGGPVNIKEHLDEWFNPLVRNWIRKCSIVNADFFEESDLIHHCRQGNLIKAYARIG